MNARPLRADARDNRRRLLDAARDVFIELGPGAPLEEIARRAGTGIATLYRRFPDRHALIRDVVVDALRRTTDEARQAMEEEPDPFGALARYMHRAVDVRTAAVIPAAAGRHPAADQRQPQPPASRPAARRPQRGVRHGRPATRPGHDARRPARVPARPGPQRRSDAWLVTTDAPWSGVCAEVPARPASRCWWWPGRGRMPAAGTRRTRRSGMAPPSPAPMPPR